MRTEGCASGIEARVCCVLQMRVEGGRGKKVNPTWNGGRRSAMRMAMASSPVMGVAM